MQNPINNFIKREGVATIDIANEKNKQIAKKITKANSFVKVFRKQKLLLLMLLPALTYIIIFRYLPMAGIILAFKDFNYQLGIFRSPWVGFSNFKFLIISNQLYTLTRNTLLYNLGFIILGITLEVGFAVIINELGNKYFKKLFQSFMFLPYFISWVVVAAIVQASFGYEYGFVNNIIEFLGGERFNIYANTSFWPFLIIFIRAWKMTGYGTVVYLASVSSLDPVLFEAAAIDGANVWQRISRITIPSLLPTIIIMFLLAVGQIFRGDFGLFYQLVGNNGQLLDVADILDLFIYRALTTTNDIGMASAAGLFQSVLCFLTIIAANWSIKRFESDYSLF